MNQKFYYILLRVRISYDESSLRRGKIFILFGSMVVAGSLIRWALLHFVYDLKIPQMNVKRNLIRKCMLYKFDLDLITKEVTITIQSQCNKQMVQDLNDQANSGNA